MNFRCDYGLGDEAQASGQPVAQWARVLFLATPTGERSLMHPKPPPDKHAASQERQKLILFCFHPFSQCTSVELTDI